MKIRDILKTTAGLAGALNPAVGAAVQLFNALAPKDQQIPADASRDSLALAIERLPPETRERLLEHDLEVQLAEVDAWARIQQSHSEADAANASTRPLIAVMMAGVVAVSIVPISLALAYAVVINNTQMVGFIDNAVLPLLALIGTPTLLLRAYFGMRTKEKQARYAASVGQEVNPSVVSTLLRTLKGEKLT